MVRCCWIHRDRGSIPRWVILSLPTDTTKENSEQPSTQPPSYPSQTCPWSMESTPDKRSNNSTLAFALVPLISLKVGPPGYPSLSPSSPNTSTPKPWQLTPRHLSVSTNCAVVYWKTVLHATSWAPSVGPKLAQLINFGCTSFLGLVFILLHSHKHQLLAPPAFQARLGSSPLVFPRGPLGAPENLPEIDPLGHSANPGSPCW